MRTRTRAGLAAAVALSTVVAFGAVAGAEDNEPLPTRTEVAAAEAAAGRRAGDVAAIRGELALAQSRLQDAAAQAEMAAEAYNGARWELQQATARVEAASEAAVAASRSVEQQRAEIAALAVESFQEGSALTGLRAYLSPGGPQDIADRISVTQNVGATLDARYQEFAAADALARAARNEAEEAKRDQQALTAAAARRRDAAAAAATAAQTSARAIAEERTRLIVELAEAQKISVALATRRQDGLERIAQEKAAEAARQAAAERAAQLAAQQAARDAAEEAQEGRPRPQPERGPGAAGPDAAEPDADPVPPRGDQPPTAGSGAAAKAIKFARAQLGEPYQWAAAGPGSWDCSGLTMMAWREGGVSLPHYSAAQYSQSTPIGVNDLRPGDLVFWGSSPGSIHHVALYIGNSQIIHAPRTGRPVAIDSMYYWVPPSYFGRP